MIKGQSLLLKFQRIAPHYHNENTAKTDMAKMRPLHGSSLVKVPLTIRNWVD
jgi:hypothetical protein